VVGPASGRGSRRDGAGGQARWRCWRGPARTRPPAGGARCTSAACRPGWPRRGRARPASAGPPGPGWRTAGRDLADHALLGQHRSAALIVITGVQVHHWWARELAEQGVGERQLAEVCQGGRGQPATRAELDAALTALAGPDGLTEQVSTFTRADVVDALAKRLPVAPSAQQALTQAEQAADRFLQERVVRVAHDRRLGVDRFSTPELLALERQLVDGATGRASAAPSSVPRSSARSWTGTPPPERTRRPWCATSPKAATGWRWWSAGPAAARPGRWGWPGRRSS
jgi:hypothetical protein